MNPGGSGFNAFFWFMRSIQKYNNHLIKEAEAWQNFWIPMTFLRFPGTEGWERMYPYHYQFTTDDPEAC